jgi:hypothetical protein
MLSAHDLIGQISSEMGMLPVHLEKIIRTAPLRYKVFYIKKRSGGLREVAQPARELKAIQRLLIKKLEQQLPVHSAATAYRSGMSIKDNVLKHVNSNYLLKMDFQKFFPSITATDIKKHLEKYCATTYDASAIKLIAYVCCWAPKRQPPLRLCIGAPSSPLLSNSLLFDFDVRLAEAARAEGVIYTRYADDLALSSKKSGVLDSYVNLVVNLVSELDYPRLTLNKTKTVFASRSGRRTLTGLNITPDFEVSIGRERKRLIRAMYHRNLQGLLSPKEQEKLSGLIAFANNIEPSFSDRLRK